MPKALYKETRGFKTLVWAILIVPLILSITVVCLTLAPESTAIWSRIALYIAIILCIFSIFNSLFLALLGKIKISMGLTCIISFLLYSLTSLMLFGKIEPTTAHLTYYTMNKNEKKEIYNSLSSLNLGDNYIVAMKKLPPVPEGAPVTMRTSKSNGIVLRYYLERKSEDAPHRDDSHITLFFDKNQRLIEVANANIN